MGFIQQSWTDANLDGGNGESPKHPTVRAIRFKRPAPNTFSHTLKISGLCELQCTLNNLYL